MLVMVAMDMTNHYGSKFILQIVLLEKDKYLEDKVLQNIALGERATIERP